MGRVKGNILITHREGPGFSKRDSDFPLIKTFIYSVMFFKGHYVSNSLILQLCLESVI